MFPGISSGPHAQSSEAADRRAVLCECADMVQAETIRIRLAVEGIHAFVTGTDAATALSMGGAGTDRLVRVEVPEEDFHFAYDLLEEDKRRTLEAGPWICSRCREQNEAAFELCWSCSKLRNASDERGRLDLPTAFMQQANSAVNVSATPHVSAPPSGNPYRPIVIPTDHPNLTSTDVSDPASEHIRDDVMRAFRAAVIGVLLFPPLLTLYSVILLVRTDHHAALRDNRLRGWFIGTICINFIVILGVYQFVRAVHD